MRLEQDNSGRVQHLTTKVLVRVAAIAATEYEKFAGWLVAGLGAALALLVSNLDKTKGMIETASVSYAIKIFVAILIAHTAQKILVIIVTSGSSAQRDGAIFEMQPPLTGPELSAFFTNMESAYPWPMRWAISKGLARIQKGELIFFGKWLAGCALFSAGLAVAQVLLAIWAVLVIAKGLP